MWCKFQRCCHTLFAARMGPFFWPGIRNERMTCGLCECTAAAALCSSVALESRRIPPTNLAILQQPHSMRYFDLRSACFILTLTCIIGFEIGKAEASCQFSRLSSRPTAFSHHQSMNGGANNSIWFDFCTTSSSTRPRASACTLEIAKKLSSALASLSLWRFTAAAFKLPG